MDYTNTGLYRFIYGLYQYRIIWNIATISTITTTTHNTGINERVKRVLYTIYQYLKRYHHFNTTIYHTGQEKHYLPISIAPHTTISHYHRMKGQRQIISSYLNDHDLLNAERYTTDGTIPPYKTTSILQDIILQDKRKHLFQRQRRIYLCRLICFLMHCNEEEKQSIKENHRQRYRTLLNATTSTLHTSIVPTTQDK